MNPDRISRFFSIAGMQIELQAPSDCPGLLLEDRTDPFSGKPPRPAAAVTVDWRESAAPLRAEGELVYDPGAIWRMFRGEGFWCAELSYADDTGAVGKDGVRSLLYANDTWDRLTLKERRIDPGWHGLFSLGAGELAVRASIVPTGGLLLHASAVDDNGRGVLFSGRSGAGKSTQLGFWSGRPGVVTMTDDRAAVRCSPEGGASGYGTPWGGLPGTSRDHSAPLAAIVMLEQAPENRIERLSPAAAAAALACRAFLPYWDRSLMQRAFANLETLVRTVPVHLLRCRPEPSVVDLVRSVL